jgi:hypothetical protein
MSRLLRVLGSLGLVPVLALLGCADPDAGLAGPPDTGRHAVDAGPPGSPSLPCDVSATLETYCTTCHASTPTTGALMPLVTRLDLRRPSITQPTRSVGDLAVERMRSTMFPMPAMGPRVPETEIATFETWVNAGMPEGSCDIYDPFAEPAGCTSGVRWLLGDHESPLMRPGGNCIQCHTEMRRGPRPALTLAGTVYQTGHEPADCYGTDGFETAYAIDVTDATGNVIHMEANNSGNFFSQEAVTFPITARISLGDRERRMTTPVMSGDCNACHTDVGDMMAPGRIVLP